jgi:hypothetical protein
MKGGSSQGDPSLTGDGPGATAATTRVAAGAVAPGG